MSYREYCNRKMRKDKAINLNSIFNPKSSYNNKLHSYKIIENFINFINANFEVSLKSIILTTQD